MRFPRPVASPAVEPAAATGPQRIALRVAHNQCVDGKRPCLEGRPRIVQCYLHRLPCRSTIGGYHPTAVEIGSDEFTRWGQYGQRRRMGGRERHPGVQAQREDDRLGRRGLGIGRGRAARRQLAAIERRDVEVQSGRVPSPRDPIERVGAGSERLVRLPMPVREIVAALVTRLRPVGDLVPAVAGLGEHDRGVVVLGSRPVLVLTDADRIAGAMLNDIGPEIDQSGIDRIGSYVGREVTFPSWEQATALLAERNREVFPRWDEGAWERFARRIMHETPAGIAFQYDMRIADNFRVATEGPQGANWNLYEALAGRPVLILRGGLSDLLSDRVAQLMADRLAGDAELVTVPDVGHTPNLEEPEAQEAMDRLLARVAERPD